MKKTAAIVDGTSDQNASPCERCGAPACTIIAGVPLCSRHASVGASKAPARIQAIDKVAADLSDVNFYK
jgi:hypothetical protein